MNDNDNGELNRDKVNMQDTIVLDSNDIKNIINDTSESKYETRVMDKEFEESIKQLVEEETTVARATFADNGKEHLPHTNVRITASHKNEERKPFDEKESDFGNNESDNKIQNDKKKCDNKKRKKAVISAIAGTVIIISAIAIYFEVSSNNKKQSFDYNYSKGVDSFNKGNNVSEALEYLTKAYNTDQGRKNTDLMRMLYKCYFQIGEDSNAIDTINALLELDKYNKDAILSLGEYYDSQKNANELNALIEKYTETPGKEYLSKYQPQQPQPSSPDGEYSDAVELTFSTSDGSDIYYSLDGADPKENGVKYSQKILIDDGITKVKAVSKNNYGVYSDMVELQYTVKYETPDDPKISLESGTYPVGTVVTVDNLPENAKAYYTTDGSMPTQDSTEYSEPIQIPVGNTVLSVIFISEHGTKSSVVRKNYVINEVREYTYDEAVVLLKNRMIAKNFLSSDGNATLEGSAVSFEYQSKKVIDDIDMYYIRCDVKKGQKTQQSYYGVGVKDGKCYSITDNAGNLAVAEY